MPKLSYNLDELPDTLGVPAGRYRAKLVSCTKDKSKTSGNPMLTWTWKVLSGKHKGATIKSWTSLQEGALVGLKQTLTAFGLKGKINRSTDQLIGRIVVLVVVDRPSTQAGREGEMFSSIQQVLPKDASLKASKKSKADLDDEDEEDEDDEDQDEADEDEEDEEEDEDEEDEEDDDDEGEEEDERQRSSSKKKARR